MNASRLKDVGLPRLRFRGKAIAAWLLIAILSSVWGAAAQSTNLGGSADSFALALADHMPALLVKYHVPGAVVSCIENGEVIWTKAYGLANVKTRAPMKAEMVFEQGSNGKVLTAWGVMRLVEEGKIDLDAPANHYLKRWQLRSAQFDPNMVTIRRLLSHTGGLTGRGFMDYNQRRRLPTLEEMLEGKNQVSMFNGEINGPVLIKWQPGSRSEYSGGGFLILQMVIEDVTGESFVSFMNREVTTPLGLTKLGWRWTPQLEAVAPMPYGEMQEPVGYRQLGCEAIGSEICSVPDFARFVAAAVAGRNGKTAGRGVLRPESIAQMLEVQTNSDGSGLGYGIAWLKGHKMLGHSGANPGWNARFSFDASKGQGFVIANNSALGGPLNTAVDSLWWRTMRAEAAADPPPATGVTVSLNRMVLKLVQLLWAFLLLMGGWIARQAAYGKRQWIWPPSKRRLLMPIAFIALSLLWWYWFYAPRYLPLRLSPVIPDIWVLPLVNYIASVLLGCVMVTLLCTFLPKKNAKLKN